VGRDIVARIMAKNDSVLNPDKLTQEADLFFTCSSSI
jgi:hypothetical protein